MSTVERNNSFIFFIKELYFQLLQFAGGFCLISGLRNDFADIQRSQRVTYLLRYGLAPLVRTMTVGQSPTSYSQKLSFSFSSSCPE